MTNETRKWLGCAAVTAAVTAWLAAPALAGKLERGNRTISPIFERGTYAEFAGALIVPFSDGTGALGESFGDFYNTDTDFGIAAKFDITPRLSSAFIVDEPFGASIAYGPGSTLSGIRARLSSVAVTSLYRYKFDQRFSIYGGTRSQRTKFNVGIPQLGGYGITSDGDWGFGFVAGAAFEIPQMRVRASLTYHSEIEHEWNITGTQLGLPVSSVFKNQTPQGVDFDFQFPLAKTTLMYGGVHWADWSETSLVTPSLAGPLTILEYNDDVWSVKLGIAQLVRPNLILSADVTYEFEQEEDISPFRTREGEVAIGLAATYLTRGLRATAGMQYKWFNDNTGGGANPFGIQEYRDQSALVLGIKLGYSLQPTPPAAPPMK